MEKAIFFDTYSHIKTGSSVFFQNILKARYELTIIIIDRPLEDKDHYILHTDYDYLFFWQRLPNQEFFQLLHYKKAFFIPMYDDFAEGGSIAEEYHGLSIISFAYLLHQILTKDGFQSFYIQYFPEPQPITSWGDPHAAFFWNRRLEWNVNAVYSACQNFDIQKMHIHKVLDLDLPFLEPDPQIPWEFTYSDWFEHKEDMTACMEAAAFYIAPRMYEGIGMSFLEAMAMGRCVIALNLPTMSEYILPGKTGFLYTGDPISPVDDIRKVQELTHRYMIDGYHRYQDQIMDLYRYIES